MYCKIYVTKKNIGSNELSTSISLLIGGNQTNNIYVEKEGYSIEVDANDEYDAIKEKHFPDGFLFFPFTIEIDIYDNIKKETAAQEVGGILKFLWENGYTAIASCDFEDLLPENGGYKSKNIPWIE